MKREFQTGDRVEMKKKHPCGGFEWELLRVGADVRIRCATCGRELMLPRHRFETQLKKSGKQQKNGN